MGPSFCFPVLRRVSVFCSVLGLKWTCVDSILTPCYEIAPSSPLDILSEFAQPINPDKPMPPPLTSVHSAFIRFVVVEVFFITEVCLLSVFILVFTSQRAFVIFFRIL